MLVNSDERRLEALLSKCADGHAGIIFYTTNEAQSEYLDYRELRNEASLKARYLQHHHGVMPGRIVLVHFNTRRENITRFWATVLAGCVPAKSTPWSTTARAVYRTWRISKNCFSVPLLSHQSNRWTAILPRMTPSSSWQLKLV